MIGSILGAAASGGLTGIIGTVFQGVVAHRERINRRAHECEIRKLDQEEMRLEAALALEATQVKIEGQVKVAKTEQQTAAITADAKTQTASYQHDQARYGGGFVDGVRGMMRPAITAYTLFLLSWIGYLMYRLSTELGSAGLDVAQVAALLEQSVACIIYLATTSVTWWFGSRPQRQAST